MNDGECLGARGAQIVCQVGLNTHRVEGEKFPLEKNNFYLPYFLPPRVGFAPTSKPKLSPDEDYLTTI